MWQDKGRSGYGDSTIGGDYDSWAELSPNGKQWKNPVTMLTRDLSGADYWHLRKQNRPTEEIPAELHMLKNGKANINAYADKTEPVKKATKVPLKNRILPQASRVDKLRSEAIELELAFKAGEFTPEEYTLLRDVAFRKLHRAEELLKKAITPDRPTLHEDDEYADEMPEVEVVYDVNSSVSPTIHTSTWIDDLPASNSLKLPLQKTLQVVRMLVKLSHKAGSYWQELKEV